MQLIRTTMLVLVSLCILQLNGQTRKVILDADTGNEVDDLYAIVRALVEPSWEVIALNATQWQSSQWAVDQTMEESHRLNQVLVSYLKMNGRVKTLRGGMHRMYDWGDKAQHSAAAYGIIKEAHAMPPDQKLTVVAIGALTNVASALYIDPSISERIEVYWLGLSYDFSSGVSKRIDFNAVMDPQATDLMLSSDVEMHIIPHSVSVQMTFDFATTAERMQGIHPLADFLVDRWYHHMDGGRYERTIWDLGLIGAMVYPDWAEEVRVTTFENPNVWLFREIDSRAITEDFYQTASDFLKAL